jgi:predicted dehydrogenase
VKILIVGLGSIAKKHIAAISSIIPNAVIYALRSMPSQPETEGIINIYSITELSTKPDFILICNPTAAHYESIRSLSKFKVPLFIEKPVLDSLKHAEELSAIVRDTNLITYVACNMRFHPSILFLKSYIQRKRSVINEVNIYCGSYLPDWRPGVNFREVYSAKANEGGGVHLDLIHELDYCRWLFGMPNASHCTKTSVSSLQVEVCDFAKYEFTYPSFTASVILNYYRRDPKRQVEILFEDETLTADLLTNTISSTSDKESKVIFAEPYHISDTYSAQMNYFIDNCVNGGRFAENSFFEAVEVLKLAIHE